MRSIQKIISNLIGWRTKRKLVVIESDDWGSIRMPSLKTFERLKNAGLNLTSGDNGRFNTLDTLASAHDFEALFSTLKRHKDHNGNHPVITAMSLSANPDFEKIENANFERYFYEPLTATLERYGYADAFTYWQHGEQEKLFYPEFHGREHLNVGVWMDDLRRGDAHALAAFREGFWGFRNKNKSCISYQAAFDLDQKEAISIQKEIIADGLRLFQTLHKRPALYFVPPNGPIHDEVMSHATSHGIRYVCTAKIHYEPQGDGKVKKRFRYLGKKRGGLLYLTRNCFFEPSYMGKGFGVQDCLKDVESAFAFRKPAIISTHRVNFIGGLNTTNRKIGNEALDQFLRLLLKKWPDIEFMTSSQLGKHIQGDDRN